MRYELRIQAVDVVGRIHYTVSLLEQEDQLSVSPRPQCLLNGDMAMPETTDPLEWSKAVARELAHGIETALTQGSWGPSLGGRSIPTTTLRQPQRNARIDGGGWGGPGRGMSAEGSA